MYDIIYIHLKSEYPPNPSIILNEMKEFKERSFLSGLLFDLEKINPTILKAKECLTRLEKCFFKNKLANLREELKKENLSEMNKTIKQISKIEDTLRNIDAKYDNIN